ncbi:MAG: putative CAMK family protein kinase [Streblomastix strix]|uniref:Putative CAMK family protein kinase n=1 Tax=Streblomastix strix TaxID=222440 RepID=A0A5J4WK31_9EUKA|nr:MAG: putative CAMK family protein kinase [Streblomastix strix]
MDYENILRNLLFVPITILGRGSFGSVYLTNDLLEGIIAAKIILRDKFKKGCSCPFLLEYNSYIGLDLFVILRMTLNVIAEQPEESQISLPSYTLRALMKQILEGMRAFHEAGLIHRDIKCSNILLHSPPGTGRVYAKISDFGLAKQEDSPSGKTSYVGTIPNMAPELFIKTNDSKQKADIYALGITFYHLITHKYPMNEKNYKCQKKMMATLKSIERPEEIKDDILWDLLSKMLEFDPDKRITAAEALQHPYFTSPEAFADISKVQQDLAQQATQAELNEIS